MKHTLARGLMLANRVLHRLDGNPGRWLTIAWRETHWQMTQWCIRTANLVDDKVPCPHCGRQTPKVTIEDLKTYCWDCSDWGQPPRETRYE